MSHTLGEIRTEARLLAQDSDTINPGLVDVEWTNLINQAQQDFAALTPEYEVEMVLKLDFAVTDKRQTLTSANPLIRYLSRCERTSDGGSLPGVPMERLKLWELRDLQENTGGTSATPGFWAGHNPGIDDQTWHVYIHPLPAAAIPLDLHIFCAVYPTDLALTSDRVIFGPQAGHTIANLAAIGGAGLLGRSPEFIQRLNARLPVQYQGHELKKRGDRMPRPREQESIS
jgi:hypothetical protein